MEYAAMTNHYLVTALWSTSGDNCENLDDKYSVSDISEEFKLKALQECVRFFEMAKNYFTFEELKDMEQIGHDFWLTRNGHGAGFWDGDYVNGDAITAIVKANFPENDDELREAINEEEAA